MMSNEESPASMLHVIKPAQANAMVGMSEGNPGAKKPAEDAQGEYRQQKGCILRWAKVSEEKSGNVKARFLDVGRGGLDDEPLY